MDITITELAKRLDVSQQSISKLKKQGFFNKCLSTDKKKINLKKSIDTIIANAKTQNGKMYGNAVKLRMEWNTEESEPINIDSTIATNSNLNELEDLLKNKDINELGRVTIIQKFWAGKREELKYKEEERELIQMSRAKAIFEKLLTPLTQSMDDLPFILKESYPNVDDDVIEWLHNYINDIKVAFQSA